MSYFKYIKEENKYELTEGVPDDVTLDDPTFNQAAVLHTSEDVPVSLARAYNLEDDINFTDSQIKDGAKKRGQKVGDISAGRFLPDQTPESGY